MPGAFIPEVRRPSANVRARALPLLLLVIVTGSCIALTSGRDDSSRPRAPQSKLQNPDSKCLPCHRAIVERYSKTPMAQASGEATQNFLPGEFADALSGVDYRIFLRNGTPWMSFSREAGHGRAPLSGEEQLLYYIGSNHRGRTYLYERDGLWFELPVNLYAHHGWDMTPRHLHDTNMPDDLPIDVGCLHCHTTSVAAPRPNARNSFPMPPFAQGGIGCAACHGDPSAHLAAKGHGPILNPAKLTPAKRDSVCTQCHLEGNVTIDRPNQSLANFAPGADLNHYEVYFVLAAQATGGARATSQWEALAASACTRGAGDRMTCTTCHDPHGDPQSQPERVEYFRARCLTCHTSPQLAMHHPEERNCASCHMPRSPTSDIAHDQVTDHDIERHPHHQLASRNVAPVELVPVSGFTASDRELGLAYAQWASTHNDPATGARALTLLERAEKGGADDAPAHENLGFLNQLAGNTAAAEREYRAALAKDPYSPVASTDLAILDLRSGHGTGQAAQLLERLVAADPAQTRAGLTLAVIECLSGQTAEARALALKLQTFAWDSPEVREFLEHGSYSGVSCPAMQQRK